jgi:hypothetical protein
LRIFSSLVLPPGISVAGSSTPSVSLTHLLSCRRPFTSGNNLQKHQIKSPSYNENIKFSITVLLEIARCTPVTCVWEFFVRNTQ